MDLQSLPIGDQGFASLRGDNYLYVDKTELISLMCALSKRAMDGYWFDSGTPTMLVEMLRRKHYALPTFEEPVSAMKLDNKTGDSDSIMPLLYQSGYLSIDRMSDDGRYWLTFPNDEVREGFFEFLLPYYATVPNNDAKIAISDFVKDILDGNVEQFLQRLQSFFADFQYDAQTTPESHFRNVLYILCKLMGLQVDAEYQTSDGRIDLLLRTDKFVYVIECKIDSTARIALDQIKDKSYALPWSLDNREKILIGLNFSITTRRPDDWIIERADGSQKVDQKSGPEKWTGTKLNERQEAIVEWISNHPNTTYDEMSERFGVSRQTIYKDTKKLQALGVIIREGEDFGGIWKRVSQ